MTICRKEISIIPSFNGVDSDSVRIKANLLFWRTSDRSLLIMIYRDRYLITSGSILDAFLPRNLQKTEASLWETTPNLESCFENAQFCSRKVS